MSVFFFAGVIVIAVLDQLVKSIVVNRLMSYSSVPVIDGVFHFTYCENSGAGFGVFSGYTWILSLLTILIVLAVMAYVLVKKPNDKLLMTSLTLMTGGAVGNLIDRLRLGYVVDFLDFRLINFPIFNIADCFITIGAVVFAVYVIFFSDKKECADEHNEGEGNR